MILFPKAKINIGLNVKGKRADGYHELETVMVPIPLFDIVEIIESDTFSFTQSGLAIHGNQDSNLCVRAYKLMNEKFDIPAVKIHLRKQIPMGAGLGGGSADATQVIIAINSLFDLNLSVTELQNLSAELGSDCPFFVVDKPQLAKGRGEILEEINMNLSGYFLKVINPNIHVSTKEAFEGITPSEHLRSIESIVKAPINSWKGHLHNDFENHLFRNHPELLSIKEGLYKEGAIYASMSGSGSTLYGIFPTKPLETPNTRYYERILCL